MSKKRERERRKKLSPSVYDAARLDSQHVQSCGGSSGQRRAEEELRRAKGKCERETDGRMDGGGGGGRAATEGFCPLLVNVPLASPLMLGAGGHLLRSARPAGVSRRRLAVQTRQGSQMEGRCDNEKHKGDG